MRKRRISCLCTFQGSDDGFSVFCCYSICFHKNNKAGESAGSSITLRGREAVRWEDDSVPMFRFSTLTDSILSIFNHELTSANTSDALITVFHS